MSRRRALGALAAAVVVALPAFAACTRHDGQALSAPSKIPAVATSSSSTTATIDLTAVSIQPIGVTAARPTTTTRPLEGAATISGRVLDSSGAPVDGALVRATYYGDPSRPDVIEALAGPDGSYRFDKLLGGRWRIRAWKAPALATTDEMALFLGATEARGLDLRVTPATDLAVTSAIAPKTPFVGQPVQLAVLVLAQSVDDDGSVSRSPQADTSVVLTNPGGWSSADPDEQVTDHSGKVTWQLTCLGVGAQDLSVIISGREYPLTVPACVDPASTTTTTLPAGVTTTTAKRAAGADTGPRYDKDGTPDPSGRYDSKGRYVGPAGASSFTGPRYDKDGTPDPSGRYDSRGRYVGSPDRHDSRAGSGRRGGYDNSGSYGYDGYGYGSSGDGSGGGDGSTTETTFRSYATTSTTSGSSGSPRRSHR